MVTVDLPSNCMIIQGAIIHSNVHASFNFCHSQIAVEIFVAEDSESLQTVHWWVLCTAQQSKQCISHSCKPSLHGINGITYRCSASSAIQASVQTFPTTSASCAVRNSQLNRKPGPFNCPKNYKMQPTNPNAFT